MSQKNEHKSNDYKLKDLVNLNSNIEPIKFSSKILSDIFLQNNLMLQSTITSPLKIAMNSVEKLKFPSITIIDTKKFTSQFPLNNVINDIRKINNSLSSQLNIINRNNLLIQSSFSAVMQKNFTNSLHKNFNDNLYKGLNKFYQSYNNLNKTLLNNLKNIPALI